MLISLRHSSESKAELSCVKWEDQIYSMTFLVELKRNRAIFVSWIVDGFYLSLSRDHLRQRSLRAAREKSPKSCWHIYTFSVFENSARFHADYPSSLLTFGMQKRMKLRSKKPSKRLKGDSPERYCKHHTHAHIKVTEGLYLSANMFYCASESWREAEITFYVENSTHLVDAGGSAWAEMRMNTIVNC